MRGLRAGQVVSQKWEIVVRGRRRVRGWARRVGGCREGGRRGRGWRHEGPAVKPRKAMYTGTVKAMERP